MRKVHLVGSLPAESAEDAFAMVADELGDRVIDHVPDGETGDRSNWIGRLIESHRDHPDLELAREGAWTSYEDTPAFKVRRGHAFEWVELDYVEAFRASWPAFQAARPRLPVGTRLQVGIPGVLDLAMSTFGFDPTKALRNTGPFRDATVRELTVIADQAGSDVVFQIEIPIELGMLHRVPSQAQAIGAAAKLIAKEVATTVSRGPLDAHYGLHLCYGDLNNRSMITSDDLRPTVALTNALVKAWPPRRPLEFVHLPFAHGEDPAPTDPEVYAPLGDLAVSPTTRVIAGFVHEKNSEEESRRLLETIEGAARRQVDVAAACGLGRRDRDQAVANLRLSHALAG